METRNATGDVSDLLASAVIRSILSAGIALVFYGAWAAWANRMHEMGMIVRASVTQGLYSAAITLVMTSLVEALYRGDAPRASRLFRAIAATVVVLVLFSSGIHLLVGTQEIFMTVLPSWVFGSLYAGAYAVGLSQADMSERS